MTHCVCLSILRWSGAETKVERTRWILDATPQHLFIFPVAVAAPPSPLERSLDPADDGHHPADLGQSSAPSPLRPSRGRGRASPSPQPVTRRLPPRLGPDAVGGVRLSSAPTSLRPSRGRDCAASASPAPSPLTGRRRSPPGLDTMRDVSQVSTPSPLCPSRGRGRGRGSPSGRPRSPRRPGCGSVRDIHAPTSTLLCLGSARAPSPRLDRPRSPPRWQGPGTLRVFSDTESSDPDAKSTLLSPSPPLHTTCCSLWHHRQAT